MGKEKIIRNIMETKCIAIVRGVEAAACLPLAKALYEGGINLMEITFDQGAQDGWKQTVEGISAVAAAMHGRMYVGAGTVMSEEQLDAAKEAGAEYIISPHTNCALIKSTVRAGLISIPGAMTPSEAAAAYEAGASFVKLFPAGTLGAPYIKAITAPLKHIPFLAVGDVDENNAADLIAAGAAGVGVGGNLINKTWIKAQEFGKITALTKVYISRIKEG